MGKQAGAELCQAQGKFRTCIRTLFDLSDKRSQDLANEKRFLSKKIMVQKNFGPKKFWFKN